MLLDYFCLLVYNKKRAKGAIIENAKICENIKNYIKIIENKKYHEVLREYSKLTGYIIKSLNSYSANKKTLVLIM